MVRIRSIVGMKKETPKPNHPDTGLLGDSPALQFSPSYHVALLRTLGKSNFSNMQELGQDGGKGIFRVSHFMKIRFRAQGLVLVNSGYIHSN